MDGINNNPFSNDDWIQQYPNTSIIDHAPTISSSVYSQATTDGPKPIRRRSRASRKTPTTILNASPNDFRALVQRFTGCNTKDHHDSVSVVHNLPKGPVNIDFARNDLKEAAGSSRYTSYAINNNNFNQVRLPLHGEHQMQSVDGRLISDHHIHAGNYEIMEDASVVYESSLLANDRDSGVYNNI